ncbi:MAG: efflux RND transporter periplasmic adaptor subunit [Tannerella sp.]|jgi:RND family efflux transporter MFP subunit|nr:efflux RND transporter periplasmic adaptor subunit [Tannerella sp.]
MKILKNYLIIVCAAAFTACGTQPTTNQSEIETPVSVVELKPSAISKLINTTGSAQATYGTDISNEMSGLYQLMNNPRTGKPFKLGDQVTKGQIIIRLDDEEYVTGIAIASKKLNLEISEAEQTKQKQLYEKGGVTLSEMRNTEVSVMNARNSVATAELNLEKMNIRAPFDGVIVNLPHHTVNAKVNQGQVMVGIMAYSKMFMEVNLPESSINYIKENQPVYITHYTLPQDTLKGIISEISPAISTETRTFKGKITIDNPELKLRPGMFVKADIVVDRAEETIIIPKEVVMSSRNRKYVFIVERNTAYSRNIVTGLEDEDNIQVIEGLSENEYLVTRGYETLRDNSRVKVLN